MTETGERSWKLAAKALNARDWWLKREELPKNEKAEEVGTSLGANASLEAAVIAQDRFRGMLIEMPVPPGMKKTIDEMNTRVNDPRAQIGTPFREPQINNRF